MEKHPISAAAWEIRDRLNTAGRIDQDTIVNDIYALAGLLSQLTDTIFPYGKPKPPLSGETATIVVKDEDDGYAKSPVDIVPSRRQIERFADPDISDSDARTMATAFQGFWRRQSRMGDPARNSHIVTEAFKAGWNAHAAHTAEES